MSENSNANTTDHHNRGGLLAFVFSMVSVFAFMAYLAVADKGVNLDEKVVDPAQQNAGATAVAFDISKVSEPWVSTPEIVAYGTKLFSTNCAMCHGNAGQGDGPAGAGLNPKPRNLVEGQWTQGNDLTDHFKVLANGITGTSMASYKHFPTGDRWALTHFIETITKNKSKEDPAKVAEFAKSYKD